MPISPRRRDGRPPGLCRDALTHQPRTRRLLRRRLSTGDCAGRSQEEGPHVNLASRRALFAAVLSLLVGIAVIACSGTAPTPTATSAATATAKATQTGATATATGATATATSAASATASAAASPTGSAATGKLKVF